MDINVAIVEDQKEFQDELKGYLKSFFTRVNIKANCDVFNRGYSFIDSIHIHKNTYDIVFLDVDLPDIDGIEISKRLRKIDKQCILIFITVMKQYAIRGYEVDALDYLIKPVNYHKLEMKLDKAIELLKIKNDFVLIKVNKGPVVKVDYKDIYYIQSCGHICTFVTKNGDFETYRTLTSISNDLKNNTFIRISNSYIINIFYVEKIYKYTILIKGKEIPVKRSLKKTIMKSLAERL